MAEEDAFEAAVAVLPRRGPDAQGTLTNKSQSSTFCFPEVRHLLDVQWFSTDVDTEDGLTMLKLILRGTEVVDLPDAHLELQACVPWPKLVENCSCY